jgi:hypothetical protein
MDTLDNQLEKLLNSNIILSVYYFKAAGIKISDNTARVRYQIYLSNNSLDPLILKKARLQLLKEASQLISNRIVTFEDEGSFVMQRN